LAENQPLRGETGDTSTLSAEQASFLARVHSFAPLTVRIPSKRGRSGSKVETEERKESDTAL